MELLLHYPNDEPIAVKKFFIFKINSIGKEYLFYSVDDAVDNEQKLYFGELKNNIMNSLDKEDVEVFQKFLIDLANDRISNDYTYTTSNYDHLEVEVIGGQKTTIPTLAINKYLVEASTPAVTASPVPTPVIEPVSEATVSEVVVEPVASAVQAPATNDAPVTSAVQAPATNDAPVTNTVQAPTTNEVAPKSKKRGLLKALIVILVIILLGIGGYYGYQYIQSRNNATEPETPTTETKDTLTCSLTSTTVTIYETVTFASSSTKSLTRDTTTTYASATEYNTAKAAYVNAEDPLGYSETTVWTDATNQSVSHVTIDYTLSTTEKPVATTYDTYKAYMVANGYNCD